jgi:hypothetical protein
MNIEFYNVRKKIKVEIPSEEVKTAVYERTTKTGKLTTRYAVKAVDEDGTKLTKFCSKDTYDELS